MELKTSRDKVYSIVWADVASSGVLYMQVQDSRLIAQIAEDFDGLEWLERISEDQGDKRFDGYSVLTGVDRITPDVVNVTIRKGENNG